MGTIKSETVKIGLALWEWRPLESCTAPSCSETGRGTSVTSQILMYKYSLCVP